MDYWGEFSTGRCISVGGRKTGFSQLKRGPNFWRAVSIKNSHPRKKYARDHWRLRSSPAGIAPAVLHYPQNKNALQTTTLDMIEIGIWSKPAPQNPFGSFSTLRSFTGAVLRAEASK